MKILRLEESLCPDLRIQSPCDVVNTVRNVVNCKCAAIIIAHNHPSGDCSPSDNDIATTKKVVKASKVIGINVLDHLIVSKSCWYSFLDNNLLK